MKNKIGLMMFSCAFFFAGFVLSTSVLEVGAKSTQPVDMLLKAEQIDLGAVKNSVVDFSPSTPSQISPRFADGAELMQGYQGGARGGFSIQNADSSTIPVENYAYKFANETLAKAEMARLIKQLGNDATTVSISRSRNLALLDFALSADDSDYADSVMFRWIIKREGVFVKIVNMPVAKSEIAGLPSVYSASKSLQIKLSTSLANGEAMDVVQ